MNKEDRNRIIHGQVYYQGRWMSIDKKLELEKLDIDKVEQGYVRHNGEWITIDEKIARTVLHQQISEPQQVYINQTYNQQTYNIDKRTVHEHDHKHIHVDTETLKLYAETHPPLHQQQPRSSIENNSLRPDQQKMLEKNRGKAGFLEDKREEI